MSKPLFLVIRTRGPNWDDGRLLEQQDGWRPHADFMNGLEKEGFAVFAGPIVGTRDVLLVIRAADEQEVEARLVEDPWTRSGQLQTKTVHRWNLRLGSIPG